MATVENDKFYLDVENSLGLKYNEYVNQIRALALAKPSDYFKMKAAVMKSVKSDAISDLYKTLFNILSLGKSKGGANIDKMGTAGFEPCYPSQLINALALDAASTLNDHLNKVLDIILPDDFESLAAKRIEIKGKGAIVEA